MPAYLEKYGHTFVTVGAIVAAFVGLVTINGNRLDAQDRLISQHFEVVNQRLDAQDKRLDAQDKHLDGHAKRLDRLTDEVSELRRLIVGISERVSRSEGEIDVIREQLRIADTPSP